MPVAHGAKDMFHNRFALSHDFRMHFQSCRLPFGDGLVNTARDFPVATRGALSFYLTAAARFNVVVSNAILAFVLAERSAVECLARRAAICIGLRVVDKLLFWKNGLAILALPAGFASVGNERLYRVFFAGLQLIGLMVARIGNHSQLLYSQFGFGRHG